VNHELERKVSHMKWAYGVFGPTQLALGLWTVIAPASFWGLIGINDADPLVQAIYGAALCGLGIMSLLGLRRPLRHIDIFPLLMIYKTLVFIALVSHMAFMENPPLAGWLVAFFWLCVGIASALVYPWGKRRDITVALMQEDKAGAEG
jgi:hypothetical protein